MQTLPDERPHEGQPQVVESQTLRDRLPLLRRAPLLDRQDLVEDLSNLPGGHAPPVLEVLHWQLIEEAEEVRAAEQLLAELLHRCPSRELEKDMPPCLRQVVLLWRPSLPRLGPRQLPAQR